MQLAEACEVPKSRKPRVFRNLTLSFSKITMNFSKMTLNLPKIAQNLWIGTLKSRKPWVFWNLTLSFRKKNPEFFRPWVYFFCTKKAWVRQSGWGLLHHMCALGWSGLGLEVPGPRELRPEVSRPKYFETLTTLHVTHWWQPIKAKKANPLASIVTKL